MASWITPKTPGPFFPIRNWGRLRFGRLGRFRGTRNLKRTFIAPENGIPSAPNTRLGSVFFGTQFPTPKPRLQKGAVSIREWLECWFSSGMAYFQGQAVSFRECNISSNSNSLLISNQQSKHLFPSEVKQLAPVRSLPIRKSLEDSKHHFYTVISWFFEVYCI